MGTAPLFLWLFLLAGIEAVNPSPSCGDLLASASQKCQIEVKFRDGYGDGWNGNTLKIRAGPSTASCAIPTVPLTQLCATYNDSSNTPAISTLLDSDYCALTAAIPAGWNVEFDFAWTWGAWPDENFITIQLSYVQAFFGPVIVANSRLIDAADSGGQKCQIPYLDPVYTISCGPAPSPVSAVTAAPCTSGGRLAETVISWTPVIAANSSVAFAIQVDDPTCDNCTRKLGVTTGTSINVLLREDTNYVISVKALNKFGESSPTTFSYRTHSYITATVDAVLFATRPLAWVPDGSLTVKVNGALSVVGTLATDDSQVKIPVFYVANGQAQIISLHYVPPTGSAGETSFRVVRHENDVELFNSGQTPTGPKFWDATFNVSHAAPNKTCGICCLGANKCSNADPDGYCCDVGAICCRTGSTNVRPFSCCSGAQKCLTNYTGALPSPKTCAVPVSTCPDTQPDSGSACYGVLSCSYNSSCCCPGDSDEVCGPTVKYQCTGEAGATWAASNLSLPCQSDPYFSCPSVCPTNEPPVNGMCVGARTCLYAKSCCCPSEPDASNQICTFQRQLKCPGTTGGVWALTTVVPSPCPALCFSQTKAGTCPSVSGISNGTVQNKCQVDANCNTTLKCCDGPSGKSCVQPCDCSTTPTCQPWEKVDFKAGTGCCGGTKVCVTDPNSTQCPTATPGWDNFQCSLPQDKTCGNGVKTRTINTRDAVKGCVTTTETQACNITCPVNCVGAWGPCGACSSNCKGGTCTKTYKITTQASNGGLPCNYSDGAVSAPEACPNLPACPLYCPIRIVVKDAYGDGWTYGTPKGFLTIYDNTTGEQLLYQWIDKAKMNSTGMYVKSGTVLRLAYSKDKYPYEALIQITTNENNIQGAILYQDPMDISKWNNKSTTGPNAIAYYTVKCSDCSSITPQQCAASEKRQPCQMFYTDSASACGPCAPGFKIGTNITGPCVDIDECSMSNNLCNLAGAACTNIEGSFKCTCPNGTNWMYGYCETPGVCPPQRFRMEWFDMTPKQRQLYHDAWKCLYDSQMYSTLYTYHSAVPGGQYGTNYPSPFHYGHDHGSGFFYWHRTFSLRFEDMVRQCSIALNRPQLRCFVGSYWDSPSMILAANTDVDRIANIRQTFFTDDRDTDGNAIGIGQRTDQADPTHPFNFLAGLPNFWSRGPDSNTSPLWPSSDVQWGIISTSSDMSKLLSITNPHFAMHPYVGGAFGGVESARDPLFFLHHNYYDMLWEMWKVCRGKTTWASASLNERWYAVNAAQDYNPDGPMQGFTAYPQDVYDNQNLVVRQGDGSLRYTSVVYSSSSFARASGNGVISCPNVISQYFKAAIPTTAVTNALELTELTQKRSLLESGGQVGPKVRATVAVEQPPVHLWHSPDKFPVPETNSEWREHVRRAAGASHTAEDRHMNVLAHTWKARNSYLGKAAWLQTNHQDEPQQQVEKDIGQQCRELSKTLAQDPTIKKGNAYLAGLDCECDATNGVNQGSLPSELIKAFGIANLCSLDGCQVSPCPLYTSLCHGKPPPEDEVINGTSNAQNLIARLGQRLRGD